VPLPALRTIAVAVNLLFPIASASAFDVAVGEIQVTQAVQDSNPLAAVPLVAEKHTAVRVQVIRISGSPTTVTGTLRVFIDGQEITPPGGVPDLNRTFPAPHNAFIPPVNSGNRFAPLLDAEEQTLNFELLATDHRLLAAGRLEAEIRFDVQIAAAGDTNTGNDTGSVTMTLVRRGAPWIFKDRVFYFPLGAGLAWPPPAANRPDETFIAPRTGDLMIPAIWPIPDAPTNTGTVTNPVFPPLLPGFTFLNDCDGDGRIGKDPMCDERALLLDRLLKRRQLLISGGHGPGRLVHLFAWVKDGHLRDHDGSSLLGQNVGYGLANPQRGQMIAAHEFGHMVGLDHNLPNRPVLLAGWDVGARLHNRPLPMAGLTGRVKAVGGFEDVMNDSPLATTGNTWIDPTSYATMVADPKMSLETDDCEEGFETVVINGMPYRGRLFATAFRYPWCTPAFEIARRANMLVRLELLDAGATRSRLVELPIDATIVTSVTEGLEETMPGPFAVPVPVPKGTRVVSVGVEGLGIDVAPVSLKASASSPVVGLVWPKAGTTLSGVITLSWTAGDRDPGTALTYQVAFSPNGGRDFVPLDVDLRETRLTIDARRLPRTEPGRGLIRVFASDGVHTAMADVGGLSLK
jgi:hypothetical protein